MTSITQALSLAARSLFRSRIVLLVFLPPVLSFVALFTLFAVYWQIWSVGLGSFFSEIHFINWLQDWSGFSSLSLWIAIVFLFLAFFPLAFMMSVILTSVFVMPAVLQVLGSENFNNLEKCRGGSTLGSLWNTLKSSSIFILLFFVTLPLWFLPGLQIFVPLVLTAWLNKKVFLYDVLQDYATPEERKRIEAEESSSLYGLGIILGALAYVPLVFFFIPVLSALSYSFYGLSALQRLRKDL